MVNSQTSPVYPPDSEPFSKLPILFVSLILFAHGFTLLRLVVILWFFQSFLLFPLLSLVPKFSKKSPFHVSYSPHVLNISLKCVKQNQVQGYLVFVVVVIL